MARRTIGPPVRAPVAADRDRDDAEGGAAQAVGILRARRHEAQAEEAGERVEAVGERQHGAGGLARRLLRARGRPILVVDRLPDGIRVALPPGVDPADDPLQVRELLDDVADEIRLREQARGPHRFDEIRPADLAGDRLGELLDAASLLTIVAQLFLERQPRELRHPRFERVLRVLVVEEAGVGEPGVEDPLAALGDEALAVGVVVHDRDEVRKQARGAAHRQELLVRPHDGHRDLLG